MGRGGKTKICNYVRVADLGSDDFHYFRWMLQSFYYIYFNSPNALTSASDVY